MYLWVLLKVYITGGGAASAPQSRTCSLPSLFPALTPASLTLALAPRAAMTMPRAAGQDRATGLSSPLPLSSPQGTSHQWPVTILSFREFTYHFRVALLVSTGLPSAPRGPGSCISSVGLGKRT